MGRKRKNSQEDHATTPSSVGEIYEKGGRVLRVRDTCQCPMCGIYFSPTEIQAHAQACLYFMEHEGEGKKKSKKGMSTSADPAVPSPTKPNLSRSDSAIKTNANASPGKSPQKPQPVHVDWKPNTVASWNVPYAPVFKPTLAEFKSPLEYISKIRPTAEKYGICVIVPPYPAESWSKNIGDPKTFTFRTKVQNIHQLKTRWQGRNEIFVANLASFLEKRGEPLRSMPKVDGRDLDLYKLFTSVVNRGGYQVVERANLWKSVADDLKLSVNSVRNNSLRNHYHKYLFAYENHRKSKLHYRPASAPSNDPNAKEDDDLYIAQDITDDLYNTDYLEEDGEDEFGFYEGEEYTLSGFEKKAKSFSEKWFPGKPTPEQVEEEFWRIVETAEDSVKVDYGSDLDVTKINRSGFSRDQCIPGKELGPYITEDHTHWNLNHLPRMKGSVLSHIGESIAGVTDPMLYIGMLFSSFCWHTEDNYLYSINYMHKGTAKTWYGIPAYAAEQFEEVMKAAVPDLFVKHPDLLHLLITMVAPSVLVANKVPIVRAVQEPGQYVITFPKAYHAGFSHGFTCAEAVNFAPADWLPFGQESVLHYRNIKRQSVFSHEELVCTIAKRDPPPETAYWLTKELTKIKEREQSSRDTLRLAGFFIQVLGPNEPEEEPKQCKICGYDCYLSHIYCSCSPQAATCLFHHAELCNTCSVKSKFLKVLVPLSDLDTLLEKCQKLQIQARSYIDLTDDDDIPIPTFPTSSSSSLPSSTLPSPPLSSSTSSALPPASPNKSATSPSAPSPMDIEKPSTSSPTPTSSSTPPSSSSSVNEPPSSVNSDAAQPVHTPPPSSASPPSAPSSTSPTPSSTSPTPSSATPSSTSPAPSSTSPTPSASSASPASPTPGSPPAPKFGIVINLSQDKGSQPGGTPPRTPTSGTPRSSPQNTPPSPHLSEHLQGIALNVPPSISGNYGKPKPSGLSKPVHIVIDSPTKA